MFLLKRLSPFLIGVTTLIGLEIVLERPEFVFWLTFFILFLDLLFLALILSKKINFKQSFKFFLTLALLFVSSFLCLIFMQDFLVKQFLVVILAVCMFFYAEYLFLFLHLPEKYKAFSLENLTSLINILTFLFFMISMFAFIVFMNLNYIFALLVIIFLSLISFILSFLAAKVEIKKSLPYVLVGTLLMAEVFVVLSWLPFSFHLKALLVACFYYLLNGVSKSVLLDNVLTKTVSKFVIVSVAVWMILFLTARWT